MAGTCYYEHYIPAKYETVTKKILAAEPTEKVITVPAKYRTVSKKILVSEGTEKLVKEQHNTKTVKQKSIKFAPSKEQNGQKTKLVGGIRKGLVFLIPGKVGPG